MGKHRHQQKYRRTVVTAVALGVIGIPSAAMACADWSDDGQRQHRDTAAPAAAEDRWGDADRYSRWSGRQHGEPAAAPSSTPTATADASKSGAPEPGSAEPSSEPSHKPSRKPSSEPKKTAPEASASKPATTAPKPTTAAPKPTTAAPKPTTAAPSPAEASGAVARVLELVNAERGKAGCSPVKVNTALTEAAQDHSEDMAASGTMSHTGSDGSSPADRITRAGYSWSTYGENVAYGYSTPEQVMQGWMNSPGHKKNILNCAFEEIGVGLAQPGSYWTQDFGTAR